MHLDYVCRDEVIQNPLPPWENVKQCRPNPCKRMVLIGGGSVHEVGASQERAGEGREKPGG